ncbi:MAG: extracellular solute-binding protein [Planctomycetota bacterium]
MNWRGLAVCVMLAALCLITWFALEKKDRPFQASLTSKQEVVFWHFWGGEDRDVVDDVVRRFNESQEQYFVRSIAMPGNNLQAKLFLSVAGGDPPDLVNQDDPVIADWGERGVIKAIDEIIPDEDVQSLESWMFDSARRLTTYQGRFYGICNGLDIRALYFNQTVLDRFGFQPPKTIEELSAISTTISSNCDDETGSFAYLPDSRRLWAWGYVFGADFYDSEIADVQVDSPEVINALRWMTSFSKKFGPDNIIAYRKGDQSLPGKAFPLLPVSDDELVGRYSILMDGQWRVRNIVEFQKDRQTRGLAVPKFGVCPLPIPKDSSGRERAGWVNGNFFVVPKNAKNMPKEQWSSRSSGSDSTRLSKLPVPVPTVDGSQFLLR